MTEHRLGSLAACLAVCALANTSAHADLEEYVKAPDAAFAWTHKGTDESEAGKAHRIELTSQVWQGITWTHDLRVYEPTKLEYPGPMVLFITGGRNGGQPKADDHALGFGLAKLCGARVAVLRQVPNQPLLDGKNEDDLISETFLRYLATKDENWPLLFPMVKSAVRAMDALQAWGKEQGRVPVQFVVTGASKRGWTTWLTGAVDPRVIAIAPMVIPTLNFAKQNPHQIEVWGKYSEQIDDYVRKGLMEKLGTKDGEKLTSLVDPYFYINRLTIPVLQINGTNDRYWTLDSMNLFWDDLSDPKYVAYLPNAGHGLDQNREYATHGIAALFRHAVTNRAMPKVSWKHRDFRDGRPCLDIGISGDPLGPSPKSVTIWTAKSETQDFRDAKWTLERREDYRGPGGSIVELPESGWFALFGDMTCEIDGLEYHLSTQIRIVPPKVKP